jgi:Zn-finger nucleic acid-binding protein
MTAVAESPHRTCPNVVDMEPISCPECQGQMHHVDRGGVEILRCDACRGVYLSRVSLGQLIEQENDWHLSSGPHTEPLPRITPDMTSPPPYAGTQRARSYIDELFG